MELHYNDIKLLAVDSEETNLLLLEEALKSEGFDVDCCRVGSKALELIKQNHFDVILLDIIMPGMDGFELRKLIRDYNLYLPIVFLTTIVDTVDNNLFEKIAEDKATYYMKKPFDREQLIKMLRTVVKTHRSEDQTRKYYNVLEENLDLASEVQQLLLPDWIKIEDNFIISSLYRSVYKVSGDIFETIKVSSGRYFVILGDIAGHGIQAALYMSAIQALVRTMIMTEENIRIDEILNRLNSFFCIDMQGKNYMTCLVALFDFNQNKLKFISAGHPSLFMYDAKTGKTELLDCGNRGAIPVGWLKDYKFNSEEEMIEIDFNDDSTFFGVTDGIIEINNNQGNTLGLEKLQSLLEESAKKIEDPLVPYYVCDAAQKTGYNIIEDDICMIMVKKNLHKNGENNHLLLTTSPSISHASMLGMEYERFIIEKTEDEMLAVRTELLLNEFLNNIIMHGLEKRQQEGPKILVDLMINNEDVRLKVWDKGKPWTFNTSPIDIDEGIWDINNKFATAGRGMAIIKSIAGKIECSRYGDLNETSFVIAREG